MMSFDFARLEALMPEEASLSAMTLRCFPGELGHSDAYLRAYF